MTVELAPFDQAFFESYLRDLKVEYTAEKVQAGNLSPENAGEQIDKEIATLLPQGLKTPNHTFSRIRDTQTGAYVGVLWVHLDPGDPRKQAFIYDLAIEAAYRRQGYASQALLALEDYLRGQGARQISLHVFGFNTGAQALYRKLGYQVTNLHMAKQL